ncbi:glycosyltransferase family 4 protein [Actinopolymorpha pittospori]|uniref:Glycosyltransferase involved in cell wall biosynthesis n=1 Tax=Actinopolymorpha pittospori TaxID=648752 RepID=A0A927RCT5_9ACTN|nr:glycosyltransferase family 4 protein [Actinopolymorpha pittospori]MBE1611612.1 glycosyltransferase involved in cell wall biosynthesis [Actinopolymorpha pittospori]
MTEVLLIVGDRGNTPRLVGLVERLGSAGLTVRVATTASGDSADLDEALDGQVAETRVLRMSLSGRRDGVAPPRFSKRWARVVARNAVVRGWARVARPERRAWLLAKYDPWIRRRATRADLIVAADAAAAPAAERAAAHNKGAVRLSASDTSFDAIVAQLAATVPLRRLLRSGLDRTTAEEVVAAWGRVAAAPDEPRLHELVAEALPIVHALRRAHAFEAAEAVAHSALGLDLSPAVHAALRVALVANQIAAGGYPADELAASVRELLAHADEALRAGDLPAVADMVVQAIEAVLNRELHADVLESPLVSDPVGFLAPLRESLTFRALRAPAGAMAGVLADPDSPERTGVPAAASPPPRLPGSPAPHRVLVVPGDYPHFTQGIISALAEEPDVELRVLNLREPGVSRRNQRATLITDRLAYGVGREFPAPAQADSDLLSWADTIFVDWCDNAALWVTMHAPAAARIVVRVHSLEAISHQPHMIDWSRVSDVIFVGGHVRQLLERAVPELAAVPGRHVVPNEMRLERFGLAKRPGAERTLAMVGWAQRVKDPLWTLDVLSQLRATDPRWRLLLIGRDFNARAHAGAMAYREEFRERAAADDVRDGLVYVGYTTDLPEVLRDAGFVISASRREGFPVGPTEGAASGAVPIMRDWPMYASYEGARGVFPTEWVVERPEEAVERILAFADPERRDAEGAAARRHVVANFDWSVVEPHFRAVLLGE